jgi:protein TonB
MSSTTTSGGVAAPVGNTLHGEAPRAAPDPSAAAPYRSERYVPPTRVTTLPRPIGECRLPKEEYPEDALRLQHEAVVTLLVTIDETGTITDVRAVNDPGHGMAAAAVTSFRRHCRFEAGRVGDTPVATTIRHTVRYELP